MTGAVASGFVVVAREGRDLEDLPDARSVLTECPSCGARARLVERALVKNLRVLGVPLIATEAPQRVYQCPRCEALCAREGDDLGAGAGSAAVDDDARVEALTERILKAEDEAALWSARSRVAAEKGDAALARDMSDQAERASRAAALLRRELGVRPGSSLADETAQGRPAEAPEAAPAPAPEASKTPAPQVDTLDDELAALRARVAEKKKPKPAPTAAPAEPVDDEVAALKAKLGRPAPPAATDAPKPEAPTGDDAPKPDAPKPDAPKPDGDDDEFAALKRKLRS